MSSQHRCCCCCLSRATGVGHGHARVRSASGGCPIRSPCAAFRQCASGTQRRLRGRSHGPRSPTCATLCGTPSSRTEYRTFGHVSSRRIEARFGTLGRVDLHLRLTPRPASVHTEGRCKGPAPVHILEHATGFLSRLRKKVGEWQAQDIREAKERAAKAAREHPVTVNENADACGWIGIGVGIVGVALASATGGGSALISITGLGVSAGGALHEC